MAVGPGAGAEYQPSRGPESTCRTHNRQKQFMEQMAGG